MCYTSDRAIGAMTMQTATSMVFATAKESVNVNTKKGHFFLANTVRSS